MGAADFKAALVAAGLGEFADTLAAMVEPGIRLAVEPGDDGSLPLGATKLGGRPDLAPGTLWPEYRGRPQAFVAQVNLRDVAALPGARRLPSSGLLSFFFDSAQNAWGFDPEHRTGCRVVHTPASARLERAAFPDALGRRSAETPYPARFEVRRLRPEPIVTYPPPDSADVDLVVPQLAWDGPQTDHGLAMAYAHVHDAIAPIADSPHNRLLGHRSGRAWIGLPGLASTRTARRVVATRVGWRLTRISIACRTCR